MLEQIHSQAHDIVSTNKIALSPLHEYFYFFTYSGKYYHIKRLNTFCCHFMALIKIIVLMKINKKCKKRVIKWQRTKLFQKWLNLDLLETSTN